MNPDVGHFRRAWAGRRLPGAARSIRWLTAVALIALAAPVEAQPAGGATYGPVQRAETLSQLAVRFRGEARVNTRQVMIAILRANPRAFGDGNINALRSGVTLRVPTVAEMEAITPGEAAAEVARHAEAWRNRRRTGSAAPAPEPAAAAAPAPRASPQPAPSAPAEAPEDGGAVAEELREARETVADLRERLSERDAAIEELLVQLAVVQRELRVLKAKAEPAPSGEGESAASAASWLPVSPLVLGSSLIVLLVLVVVVTLLRQRGDAEEALEEEPFDDAEEDAHDEKDDGEDLRRPEHERADRGAAPEEGYAGDAPATEEASGTGVRKPALSGAGAAAPHAAAPAPEGALAAGGEAAEPEIREEDIADLPIGTDLGEDEEWEPAFDGPDPGRPGPGDPGGRPDFDRHVEVGELDEVELHVDPAPGPRPDVSTGLEDGDGDGEGDDPPDDAPAPGPGERGPRE